MQLPISVRALPFGKIRMYSSPNFITRSACPAPIFAKSGTIVAYARSRFAASPSAIFSTDLHSLGQYIQQGQRTMFETVIDFKNCEDSVIVPFDPNDIVLAQHTPVQDNETEGAYSIKKIIVKRHESEDAERLFQAR